MDQLDNLLLATIFLPLVGAGLIWACAPLGAGAPRWIALATSLATLGTTGYLLAQYQPGQDEFAVYDLEWLSPAAGMDIRFSLGLDGISVWLFGLSALLTVTAVLVSWEAITERTAEFFALLLVLAAGMLGVFAARDILLFYVFFEFTLIPLFFLIGVWGSEERRHAAMKFFLFTLAGSVLTFVGLLALVLWNYRYSDAHVLTFSLPRLTESLTQLAASGKGVSTAWQLAIFAALFAGFAIKVPLFPLHTWLPLAHVQAPTAGSVILAGVLLKIGTYGFLRFNLPLLPEATAMVMPYLLWLSVAGIIYGALVALAQQDMKRLIAYSSVSHLGFCMLGMFSLNRLGVQGSVLQMVNHGLSTGGLFAIVGMIYERYHTRQISELGGLAKRTPLLAAMMVLFTFSSIGLPGLNGFTGELLVLVGAFQRGWPRAPESIALQLRVIAVLAVLGVVLGAWYMLWLVERVFFGPLKEPARPGAHGPVRDLSLREFGALAPLVVFMFWIGLCPGFFLERMSGRLDQITTQVDAAYMKLRRPEFPGQDLSPAPVAENLAPAHAALSKNDP